MNLNQPPAFNGYEHGSDFQRARTQIATPFQYLDIDLTNANVNVPVEIAGDFLYFDTANGYDGIITFELNNDHAAPMAPFTGRPGFALNALFKKLKCSWAAQPGKKVRIMYSTGERVIPALTGTLNVTGTVATLEDPMTYGASYKSNTNMAANTPDTIFTPASNINGAVVHRASLMSFNGSAQAFFSLIAKNTAPVSLIDGDILGSTDSYANSGTTNFGSLKIEKPILVPAGKGLYYIPLTTETATIRSVLYTLK